MILKNYATSVHSWKLTRISYSWFKLMLFKYSIGVIYISSHIGNWFSTYCILFLYKCRKLLFSRTSDEKMFIDRIIPLICCSQTKLIALKAILILFGLGKNILENRYWYWIHLTIYSRFQLKFFITSLIF